MRLFLLSFLLLLAAFPLLLLGQNTVSTLGLPEGYTREQTETGSYAHFVQHLPVRLGKQVETVRGMRTYTDMLAVIDLPLLFPNQDLEQCADWAMRLWAAYHRQNDRLDHLYLFNYSGKPVYFKGQSRSYRSFLQWAFAYSNSHSLKQGAVRVEANDLRPGDMLVQNETGGIGHVSVILDMCRNAGGNTLYRIGFSYMPAQEMRVLKAPRGYGESGWFTLEGIERALQDFYVPGPVVLRRFVAR